VQGSCKAPILTHPSPLPEERGANVFFNSLLAARPEPFNELPESVRIVGVRLTTQVHLKASAAAGQRPLSGPSWQDRPAKKVRVHNRP
jgi:hypothetical protein